MKKSILIIIIHFGFFCVVCNFNIQAQNSKKADSLKLLLEEVEKDSARVYLLNRIANYSSNPIDRIKYSKRANQLAVKINDLEGEGVSFMFMGVGSDRQGDLVQALEYFQEALKIFNRLDDKNRISAVTNSLSNIYLKQENYKLALEYLRKSLSISLEIGDSINIGGDLNNIGETYRLIGDLDSALVYFNKAFNVYNGIDYEYGIAYALGNIGLVFAERNKNDSAEYYINKATKILKKLGDRYPISVYQTYIADIYKDKGDINNALNYAHQSLKIAQEEGLKEQIRDASKKLAELYKDIEDYENAFKYQSQYIAYRDSINSEETIRKMADLRTEYEVSKKQAEVELLSQKQRTQQIITISLSIVLFLVAVIAFIWYQNSQSRKRTNKILSEQKEEISAQRDKLEEMVKMKDRFFGIISHDLRSPVNSLQGLSKLMVHYLDSNQYGELKSFVPMMEQSINNLSSLVDNLLSWAMSQQGELPYYPQRLRLFYTVEEVRKIFENLAQAKKIDLECNVSKELEVWADRDGLFALLRNLVNNAIKFTPENGKVSVEAQENSIRSCIKISDTGYGIPSEKIDQLFEFDKNKSTKGTAGEKGSGLGLALCKEIVHINNGTIDVQSDRNGTTFSVSLPKPEEV